MNREKIVEGKRPSTKKWNLLILNQLEERYKRLNRREITLVSGFTPSGSIHYGTLREIIIGKFLEWQVRDILGLKARHITLVDDLDPIKTSCPEWGIPESFKGTIIDYLPGLYPPFKRHWSVLKEEVSMVERLLETKMIWMSKVYRDGEMDPYITDVLKNRLKIINQVKKELSKDNKFLPITPIHEARFIKTGRFKDSEFITKDLKLPLLKGHSKMAWKVEWAAKWKKYETDFEPYGKDVGSSIEASHWISRNIWDNEPPVGLLYEFITDSKGKKISKSSGGYLTFNEVLKLTPIWNLKHILLRKPSKALIIEEVSLFNNLFKISQEIEEYQKLDLDRQRLTSLSFIFKGDIPKLKLGKKLQMLTLISSIPIMRLGVNKYIENRSEVLRDFFNIDPDSTYERECFLSILNFFERFRSGNRVWFPINKLRDIRYLKDLLGYMIENTDYQYIVNFLKKDTGNLFYGIVCGSLEGGPNFRDLVRMNGLSYIVSLVQNAIDTEGFYLVKWEDLKAIL